MSIFEDTNPRELKELLGQIHSLWAPVPGRFKDYIALPKPNGYRSLHTTVIGEFGERMEVQIRTAEMHRDAELGIAAHWKYKQEHEQISELDKWIKRITELLEDPNSDALEFLDDFKLNLFASEIFIFTPRGDIKTMPIKANALDLAYEIHTEIGHKCRGAKING